jgi:hypothetical protein
VIGIMNITLMIGEISLILTFLYLILNLDKVNRLGLFCMIGFVMVLMILYAVEHQKQTKFKTNQD